MPGYTGPYPDEWINAYNTQTPDVQAAMRETYTGKSPTEISASFTGAAGAAGSDPTYQNLQGAGFGTLPASWPQSLPGVAPAPSAAMPAVPVAPAPAPVQPPVAQSGTGPYPQAWIDAYNSQTPEIQAAMQTQFGGKSAGDIRQEWETLGQTYGNDPTHQALSQAGFGTYGNSPYPAEWMDTYYSQNAPTQKSLMDHFSGMTPQQIVSDWSTNIQPAYRYSSTPQEILSGTAIHAPNWQNLQNIIPGGAGGGVTPGMGGGVGNPGAYYARNMAAQGYTGQPQFSRSVGGNNDPNSPYDPMNQIPPPTLGPGQFFPGSPPGMIPPQPAGQPGGPPAPPASPPSTPSPPAAQPPPAGPPANPYAPPSGTAPSGPAGYANTVATVLPFLSQILAQAQPANGVVNPNATLIQNAITALTPFGMGGTPNTPQAGQGAMPQAVPLLANLLAGGAGGIGGEGNLGLIQQLIDLFTKPGGLT